MSAEALPPDSENGIPSELASRYGIISLGSHGDQLHVQFPNEPDARLLRELEFISDCRIEPVVRVLRESDASDSPPEVNTGRKGSVQGPMTATRNGSPHGSGFAPGPIVALVAEVIQRAIAMRASDVHVEPYSGSLRVRYRLDGILRDMGRLPFLQKDAIVSRIKIMAALDIAEKRRPQDGRIRIDDAGMSVDLRVSTIPTAFGEKVVLRILDRRGISHDLEEIGFDNNQLPVFQTELERPHGMILVTGPTGSGKTTTLYGALRLLNTQERNIITIEDPIEYELEGINQSHVRADIGFTFAAALRAFLRQDPDVIMVGEIRDSETAGIAVRAALTGHLVLSTLHTNDAPSTVGRLLDMGVEPFLVAGALRMVLAQRLIRCTCANCAERGKVHSLLREELDLPEDTCIRGRGCDACGGTGYRGRRALLELMPITEALSERIAQRSSVQAIREQALEAGLLTLRAAAGKLVRQGLTTPEEAVRATA